MSYETAEQSAASGDAAFLYEFRRGAYVRRFTSEPLNVTIDNLEWVASAVSHSEITQGPDVSREPITLTFPDSEAFALESFADTGDIVTTVTLYRFDRESMERRALWKGRTQKAESKQGTIEIGCESIFTSNKRLGLARAYQASCPHGVYTPLPGCGLRLADHQTQVVVVSVSGDTVMLSQTPPAGDYVGGIFTSPTGELRMIVSQSGPTLALIRPIVGDRAGVAYIAPGCNRSPERCSQFLNSDNPSGTNIENYGGQAWIPTKNPFAKGM